MNTIVCRRLGTRNVKRANKRGRGPWVNHCQETGEWACRGAGGDAVGQKLRDAVFCWESHRSVHQVRPGLQVAEGLCAPQPWLAQSTDLQTLTPTLVTSGSAGGTCRSLSFPPGPSRALHWESWTQCSQERRTWRDSNHYCRAGTEGDIWWWEAEIGIKRTPNQVSELWAQRIILD